MPHTTGVPLHLLQVASEHPVATTYVAGMTAMLTVLTGIFLARPRLFASTLEFAAVENGFDRRLIIGAILVMWSAGWPITLVVLALRGVQVVRVAWRRR